MSYFIVLLQGFVKLLFFMSVWLFNGYGYTCIVCSWSFIRDVTFIFEKIFFDMELEVVSRSWWIRLERERERERERTRVVINENIPLYVGHKMADSVTWKTNFNYNTRSLLKKTWNGLYVSVLSRTYVYEAWDINVFLVQVWARNTVQYVRSNRGIYYRISFVDHILLGTNWIFADHFPWVSSMRIGMLCYVQTEILVLVLGYEVWFHCLTN